MSPLRRVRVRNGRQRLIPWLRHLLDSNSHAAWWISKKDGIFKILWKHHSSASWCEQKSEIFKAWAIFSGKHKDGMDENWTMWKTRLRCALTRLCGVEELKHLHNLTCENPYKVYRFLYHSPQEMCDNEESTSSNENNNGSDDDNDLYEFPSLWDSEMNMMMSEYSNAYPTNSDYMNYGGIIQFPNDIDLLTEEVLSNEGDQRAMKLEELDMRTFQDEYIAGIMTDTPHHTTLDNAPLCSPLQDLDNYSDNETMLQVKIEYAGDAKVMRMITGSGVCRIYHSAAMDDSTFSWTQKFGPEVGIPLPKASDSRIAAVVNKVLDSLCSGVVVQCHAGDIWATRSPRALCSVFWKDQKARKWQKLQRDVPNTAPLATKVFDWNVFEAQVQAYKDGLGERPVCEVILSFGHPPKPLDIVHHLTVSATIVHYHAFAMVKKRLRLMRRRF